MMLWIDIAGIVFISVTMNHLGLISAIESAIYHKLWILDCPKCAAFWLTLAYGIHTMSDVFSVLTISFLASYMAIWLELFEAFVDKLYIKLYDKIITKSSDEQDSSDAYDGHSGSPLSEL